MSIVSCNDSFEGVLHRLCPIISLQTICSTYHTTLGSCVVHSNSSAPIAEAQRHSNKRELPMNLNDGDRLHSTSQKQLFSIVAHISKSNDIGSSDLDSNCSIFDCSFSSSEYEDCDSHVDRNFDLNNIDSLSFDLLSGGEQDSYDVSSGYDSC